MSSRIRQLAMGAGLVGVLLSMAVWWVLSGHEAAARRADLIGYSRERAVLVRQLLEREVDALSVLGIAAGLSAKVTTRDGFAEVARDLFAHHPALRALGWNPVLQPADRAAYEQSEGYTITERTQDGRLVAAAPRSFHVPVLRLEPLQGNEAALGYDVASEPRRFAALSRAMRTGQSSLTAPIRLVQSTEEVAGFLVFQPVNQRGQASRTTGFVVAVFEADDLVERAVPQRASPVRLAITDTTDAEPLAVHGTAITDEEAVHTEEFEVGGRHWQLRFASTQTPTSWRSSHAALLAGLILTAITVWFLVMLLRRSAQIQRLAEDKAEEMARRLTLEEERRSMREQMESMQRLESLGILAGGVAHDFNNLLTPILANAQLLSEDIPPSSPERELVDQIALASHHAADLVRQLLAYAGRAHAQPAPLSMTELVGEMAGLLGSTLGPDTNLQLELTPELPPVHADPTQLRQVVLNLLTNANDALRGERGEVSLRTGTAELTATELAGMVASEEASAGAYVFLEVKDTGCGMSEKTRLQMFEPFFTTRTLGRGLGLAATHGMLRSHRGAIRVVSEEGVGSTITVFLPVSDEPIVPVASTAPPTPTAIPSVLVVDDDDAVRAAAGRALSRAGYDVQLALDGIEGVEKVQADPDIDLVLLDLTMPRLGGAEACEQMRAIRRDLVVVITSGYDKAQAEDLPPDCTFLPKPWTLQRLLDTVARALEGEPET